MAIIRLPISRWQSLLSISTADAPWLPIVRDNIKQAAEAGGILLSPAIAANEDSIVAAARDVSHESKRHDFYRW